jgi:hypothetical protein
MQEDDRRSASGLLEIEPDIVACDGVRHLILLLWAKLENRS